MPGQLPADRQGTRAGGKVTGADSMDIGRLLVGKSKHIPMMDTPRVDLGVEPVGQDLLILDKRNNRIHRLNQTASAIWRNVELGVDSDRIVEEYVDNFDVSEQLALADVQRILTEFRALNLLTATGTQLEW
jgi:Coenzyme PQQ synthesis protein D (PqqD)